MFVNTELFSPVIKDGLCKAHPKSMEYKDWWKEQHKRCIDGYSVAGTRITGDYYWYLNFWKIRGTDKATGRKTLISPRFVDMDQEYFLAIEKCKLTGKHMVVLKARQKGFSEKHAALCGKEFSLFPHSQSIITAGEEKYSNATMKMVIRGLNSLKNTEFYKRRTPDGLDYIQAKYRVIDKGIPSWKGYFSEVYNITSRNNPQATIGKSPSLIIFEEAGRFDGLTDAFKYIQPALEAEGKKTGLAIIVGTGGDMDKGVENLEEIFYNPEIYDMFEFDNDYEKGHSSKVGYFVPAWKYKITDKDGNSLKQESVKLIDENRENARKSKKANIFINTVTQDPLVPSEAFMRTGGNMFNQALLNTQLALIKNSEALMKRTDRGRLDWVKDQAGNLIDVTFSHDQNGDFLFFEHPERDSSLNKFFNLYFAGTDSYDKDEAPSSDSLGSCSIYKGFLDINSTSNIFVARYTGRPATADMFYENTMKLCLYYNARNLIEWSNINIFKWYRDHGHDGYLKERPEIVYANVKDSKVNNKYGVDPSTKAVWLLQYRDYIEKHHDQMYDVEQIEKAIKYRHDKSYNCDITISSALAIIHAADNINLKVQNAIKIEKREFFGFKSQNGRLTQVI